MRSFLAAAAVCALIAAACAGDGGMVDSTANLTPAAARSTDCSPVRPHTSGAAIETLISSAEPRNYLLRVPPGYDGAEDVPLLLVFHGSGANAQFTSDMTGIGSAADARGWITVFPEGAGTPQQWNLYPDAIGAGDTQFVADLVGHLEEILCIDPSRVFAAGYSAGGGMALRIACDQSGNAGRLSAVAAVAATYIPCEGAVPLIAFHGSKDPLAPYDGGPADAAGGAQFPAVHRAASEWAKALGCDGLPTLSRAAPNVELSTYQRCTNADGDALLYTVLDGGHTWPGAAIDLPESVVGATSHEISANDLMLDFFEAHTR
jgi:polyhydroxybutyrate depolymerase